MRKNEQDFFLDIKVAEPPAGLFDRIILAIKREKELKNRKRILFGFLSLFIVSLVSTPFSLIMLKSQMESSGFSYFISASTNNLQVFFSSWKDFSLAIFESFPILGAAAFFTSIGILLFTLRFFLYRKRTLISFLSH